MNSQTPGNSTDESSSARLRSLSEEVNRIAAILANLAQAPGPDRSFQTEVPANERHLPDVAFETVGHLIQARRLREQFFDKELFADPAWDILLHLFQSELAQIRVPVSSLCIGAAVPPTTALRWIKTMIDVELIKRRPDPHNRKRVFIELSPHASKAMRCYFGKVGELQPTSARRRI
jgi:DNA-binding MarR family transcriptional regulator